MLALGKETKLERRKSILHSYGGAKGETAVSGIGGRSDHLERGGVISRLKERIPWQMKMGAKILLALLPVKYGFWEKLSIFKHGDMQRPEYALDVFRRHFDRVDFPQKRAGFVALELGPGDSLFSAIIAKSFGALKVYLVDVARFARVDLPVYWAMASFLRARGLSVPDIENCQTLDEVLQTCSAHYLTDGLTSLKQITSRSVDFVWSQAVLEHIRRDDFVITLQELRRVQCINGIGSHRVDLEDHLAHALNNLRFSQSIWESKFMSSSGFYTNRIRFQEMLALFQRAGFKPEVVEVDRWASLPTPCGKLAKPFKDLSREELSVSGFDVLLH